MSALTTIAPSSYPHLATPPPHPTLPSHQVPECNDLKVLRFVGSNHGQTSWHRHKSESGPPHTAYLQTTTPPPLDNESETLTPWSLPYAGHTHASQAALINSWASASQIQPCKASTRNQVIREQTTHNEHLFDSQLGLQMIWWSDNPRCCSLQLNKPLLMRAINVRLSCFSQPNAFFERCLGVQCKLCKKLELEIKLEFNFGIWLNKWLCSRYASFVYISWAAVAHP